MKKLLLIIFLISSLNLISQNSRIERNAVWTYNYFDMHKLGKEIITNTNQDTQINNIQYTILNREGLYFNSDRTDYDTVSLKNYYVRSDSCCIYFYNEEKSKELKMYDFDLMIGGQVDFLEFKYYADYSVKVKNITLNEDSLVSQLFDIKLHDSPEEWSEFSIIIKENIGAIDVNFNLYQLENPWTDIPYYELCYYKSDVQEYGNYVTSICQEWDDSLINSLKNEDQLRDVEVLVYPNPFSDEINIKDRSEKIAKIEFYDMLGQLILSTREKENIKISSSHEALIVVAYSKDGSFIKKEIVYSVKK